MLRCSHLYPQDIKLTESLEEAKLVSKSVSERLAVVERTTESARVAAESYRPVASRCAMLFFVSDSLRLLSPYYACSLNAFIVLVLRGMELSDDPSALTAYAKGAPVKLRPTADVSGAVLIRFTPLSSFVLCVLPNHAQGVPLSTRRYQWNADILRAFQQDDSASSAGASVDTSPTNASGGRDLDRDIAVRCANLKATVTFVVFDSIRRGLVQRDKLLIAFFVCCKVWSPDCW